MSAWVQIYQNQRIPLYLHIFDYCEFPIGFTKENVGMGPHISKFKDPQGICIFLILYGFPLDLLRKIQSHLLNTTEMYDIPATLNLVGRCTVL